jgi:Gly-Xaa carboxypeptidase
VRRRLALGDLLVKSWIQADPDVAFPLLAEVSGGEGASHIAPYLEKRYGRNSFALILDEGGGYQDMFGTTIAALGTGEKGYNDIRVSVKTLGGHSSVPPESGHTSIGYLSLLIAHLEANPHEPHLTRENPFYSTLVCAASHGDVGKKLDKLVKGSLGCDKKLHKLQDELAKDRSYKALIGTTQAVDLISGGIKVNVRTIAPRSPARRRRETDLVIGSPSLPGLARALFGGREPPHQRRLVC